MARLHPDYASEQVLVGYGEALKDSIVGRSLLSTRPCVLKYP